MPGRRLVDRVRLHQVDVPLGHRREPRIVVMENIQFRLSEILDVDQPIARSLECGHDLIQLELEVAGSLADWHDAHQHRAAGARHPDAIFLESASNSPQYSCSRMKASRAVPR